MKSTLKSLQRIAPALEISQTSGGETNGGGRLRGLETGVFNPPVASSVAFVVDQLPVGNLAFPQLSDLHRSSFTLVRLIALSFRAGCD
jgi:iron complex outermembrane recepter protein